MKILLDTHIFLWWINDDKRLSKRFRELIADTQNEIYLSAASCWEIAIKSQLGRISFKEPIEKFIPEQISVNGFRPLPIEVSHALYVYNLPSHHSDPFDRLLIAQSILEGIPLMTTDKVFKKYKIPLIP